MRNFQPPRFVLGTAKEAKATGSTGEADLGFEDKLIVERILAADDAVRATAALPEQVALDDPLRTIPLCRRGG